MLLSFTHFTLKIQKSKLTKSLFYNTGLEKDLVSLLGEFFKPNILKLVNLIMDDQFKHLTLLHIKMLAPLFHNVHIFTVSLHLEKLEILTR